MGAEDLSVFAASSQSWIDAPEDEGAPSYANSTKSVLRWHFVEALKLAEGLPVASAALLNTAAAMARRLQLLIENFSVSFLLNFNIARLEHNGRVVEGKNLVHEMYGDVSQVRVLFHEILGSHAQRPSSKQQWCRWRKSMLSDRKASDLLRAGWVKRLSPTSCWTWPRSRLAL